YPAWAPSESVRELTGPADGVRAVDEGAAHGHDLIKVVLHTGGPSLDDATLGAVVRAAHRHRLPVGVHAEGEGQARRAFRSGADILVPAPWTEGRAERWKMPAGSCVLVDGWITAPTWVTVQRRLDHGGRRSQR